MVTEPLKNSNRNIFLSIKQIIFSEICTVRHITCSTWVSTDLITQIYTADGPLLKLFISVELQL